MTALARSLVLSGVIVAAFLGSGVAQAATKAMAAKAAAVSTVRWATTLVTAGGQVLTGQPFTATILISGSPTVYFTARNTGTTALTAQTYTVTASGIPLSGMTLTACATGAWQNGTCAGAVSAIESGKSAPLPIAVGGQVGMKLTVPAGLFVTVSVTVSTSRGGIRPATTTHA